MKKLSAYTPESIDSLKPPSTWLDQFTGLADLLNYLDPDANEKAVDELKAPPPGTPNRIFTLAPLLKRIAQDDDEDVPIGETFNPQDPSSTIQPTPSPEEPAEDPSITNIPGGEGKKEQIDQFRGEITTKFQTARQNRELFQYDKRYYLADVLRGWDVNKWIADYDAIDSEVREYSLLSESFEYTKENREKLSKINDTLDRLLKEASDSTGLIQTLEIEIPAGIMVFDLTDGYLRDWPVDSKAIPTGEEEEVKYQDRSTTMKTFMLADGRYLAVSKEDLESRRIQRLKPSFYIQKGSKAYNIRTKTMISINEDTPMNMVLRRIDIEDYDKNILNQLMKKDDTDLEGRNFYIVLDLVNQENLLIHQKDRGAYGISEDQEETEASMLEWLVKTSAEIGIEDTQDRGPNVWRDYPETSPVTMKTNVVDNDKPFSTPPTQGAVPFLSMPNVGDVMTDRTNTRGKEGYVDYEGASNSADSKSLDDLKESMKSQYEKELKTARETNSPATLIEYYEEMIKRYNTK